MKDWDINIYRGVLTGCNEAFIISGEKREEILQNCATEDEKKRTAELIRPILRGRDIKRYGYEWAKLYLIATFPARKYNIEQYPSVKHYLLSFAYDYLIENNNELVAKNHLEEYCMKKLSQSGEYIIINGKHVLDRNGNKEKGRKKTTNKWFETQDSISYWDDFSKPKIMYPNMTKFLPFYYDKMGFFQNDKSFMITGERIAFLTAFLNSSLFKFCFIDNFAELQGGTRELRKIFFDKIAVYQPDAVIEQRFKQLVEDIQANYTKEKAIKIDEELFDIYGLTEAERCQIGFVVIT